MWISIFKVWSNKNSDRRWTNLSSYLVTLDTRHLRADGISGKRRPRPPGPGAWPRPLVMFLTPVPLSGGSGPPQVLGNVSWCLGKFYECQGLGLKCHQLMMGVTRPMRLMTTIQLRQSQETVKSEDKVVIIFMYTLNFQVPSQAIAFLSFSLTLEEIFDFQKYLFLVGTVLRTTRSWMLISDLVTIQTQGLIPTPKLQTMKGGKLIVIYVN